MTYIEENSDKKKSGCLFCDMFSQNDDEKNLIVHRDELAFVIMNKFPYNSGHVMVLPNRHIGEMDDLTDDELFGLFDNVRKCRRALDKVMGPDGFNIGINLGTVAGAGVPGHLHAHIVPRWDGDTNFMPVFGEARVISEHLESTRQKLAKAFRDL
jgi:ATP adenylyltransferase